MPQVHSRGAAAVTIAAFGDPGDSLMTPDLSAWSRQDTHAKLLMRATVARAARFMGYEALLKAE
jgi:hypothetical protein